MDLSGPFTTYHHEASLAKIKGNPISDCLSDDSNEHSPLALDRDGEGSSLNILAFFVILLVLDVLVDSLFNLHAGISQRQLS